MLGHRSVRPFFRHYAGLGSVLLYHRVTDQHMSPSDYHANIGLFVHTARFEEQIRFAKEHCRCLGMPEFTARLVSGELEPGCATVTFDDGYRDNLTLALPILEKYEVPATIYVTPGFVEGRAALWWNEVEFVVARKARLSFDWRSQKVELECSSVHEKYAATRHLFAMFKPLNLEEQAELLTQIRSNLDQRYSYEGEFLSWEEVERLAKHPLVTIGAHTSNHPVLKVLERDAAARELRSAKARLEEKLGRPIDQLAYPFGGIDAISEREHALAEEAGFSAAVTTKFGHVHAEHRSHPFAIPRINVDYFDNLRSITGKISGIESMIEHRGKRFVGI